MPNPYVSHIQLGASIYDIYDETAQKTLASLSQQVTSQGQTIAAQESTLQMVTSMLTDQYFSKDLNPSLEIGSDGTFGERIMWGKWQKINMGGVYIMSLYGHLHVNTGNTDPTALAIKFQLPNDIDLPNVQMTVYNAGAIVWGSAQGLVNAPVTLSVSNGAGAPGKQVAVSWYGATQAITSGALDIYLSSCTIYGG